MGGKEGGGYSHSEDRKREVKREGAIHTVRAGSVR